MRTESISLPKSMSLPASEEDYLEWIRSFDMLWSSATSEHAQHEMQTLIRLIEQYEITHQASRTFFTSTHIKGDIS